MILSPQECNVTEWNETKAIANKADGLLIRNVFFLENVQLFPNTNRMEWNRF